MLLKAGADVNIQEMYGDTALMLAAHRSPDVASLLAKHGQGINIKNEYGDTALSCAAKSGNFQSVQTLIEAGAQVNSKNRHNETPLMYATQENQVKTVKCLLENHADANVATKSGLVPLHIACKQNFEEICTLLLLGGADPNFANKTGERPLTFAVGSGKVNIVCKLIQAGACPRYKGPSLIQKRTVMVSPLYKALSDKRLDIARILYDAGCCSQSELYEIYSCEDLQSELEDTTSGTEVLNYLRQIACTPSCLRTVCLQNILSIVRQKKDWQEKVKLLHLPKPLVSFLLFEDVGN